MHGFEVAGGEQFRELRVSDFLCERLVHFDLPGFAGDFKRIDENPVTLIDGQIIIGRCARIFDGAEILFHVACLVADLYAKNADVLAGPAIVGRNLILGDFVNWDFFFHRLRFRRGCGLRFLFRFFGATGQAQDEHAEHGEQHYPVEH